MRKRSSNFDLPTALSPSTIILSDSFAVALLLDMDVNDVESLIWNMLTTNELRRFHLVSYLTKISSRVRMKNYFDKAM
jgi:hypothetical protein